MALEKNKGISDAVATVINCIKNNLDDGKKCIILDLSKTFDTIEHNKTKSIEILGIELNLIKSYMSNRLQTVRIKNNSSEQIQINYGVS